MTQLWLRNDGAYDLALCDQVSVHAVTGGQIWFMRHPKESFVFDLEPWEVGQLLGGN